jgi:signal transduction histidine kinase
VFARLCAGEAFIEHENHWLTRSGEPRLIAWSNSSLRGPDGGVEFLLKTGIDITERKRLEAEILKISEQQQQRIGQDLHDGICQQMAGIELMSQVLQQNLAEKSRAAADQAALIGERVRDTISETRRLARGLCPVVLESEGLMAALSELAASTERATKGRCRFQCKTPVLIGDHAVATHLYRIAQEAVSNALRHGHGSRIDILLSSTPGHLALTVRDNGVGLPEDALRRNGMGLRVMSYRAGMIGGTLAVQRAGRKGGTTVVCSVRHPAADSKEPPE